MKRLLSITLIGFASLIAATSLNAQGFGGFGGAGNLTGRSGTTGGLDFYGPGILNSDQALNFITIDGTAETRLAPEEIRVVLALTTEAVNAEDCQTQIATRIKAVLASWREIDISDDKIVEDFISVLPRYEWHLVERDGQQVRLQKREGYRMQTNLHVVVKTEQEAMAAINRAFKNGVTDIVTFDYWSSRLDDQKQKTRVEAVIAAKKKADTLLAIFDKKPLVINVQEETRVFFPRTLYKTYENVLEEETTNWNAWRDKPMIKAYRPKMTFFHGVQTHADTRPKNVAMRPEIAVVSTVRIYYQSPAEKSRTDASRDSR